MPELPKLPANKPMKWRKNLEPPRPGEMTKKHKKPKNFKKVKRES